MPLNRDDVLELHEAHMDGESLRSIAKRIGMSHESVRLLFIREDLPRLTEAEQAGRRREAVEQEVDSRREEIIKLYKRHGQISAVAEATGLPRKLVAKVIDEIPDRESYRRLSTYRAYNRDDLLADIKTAARGLKGQPLTIPAYREAARDLGLASYATLVRHFEVEDPDNPWGCALAAAGVASNPPKGRREGSTTPADCVDGVKAFILDNDGKRGSYLSYAAWARDKPYPSGSTLRNHLGWNAAVELAQEALGHVQ